AGPRPPSTVVTVNTFSYSQIGANVGSMLASGTATVVCLLANTPLHIKNGSAEKRSSEHEGRNYEQKRTIHPSNSPFPPCPYAAATVVFGHGSPRGLFC